jgi:hypothetical protein
MPLTFARRDSGSGSFACFAATGLVYASATGISADFFNQVEGIARAGTAVAGLEDGGTYVPLHVLQQSLKRVIQFDVQARELKFNDIISNIREFGNILEVLLKSTKKEWNGPLAADQVPHLLESIKNELLARGFSERAFVLGKEGFIWKAHVKAGDFRSCAVADEPAAVAGEGEEDGEADSGEEGVVVDGVEDEPRLDPPSLFGAIVSDAPKILGAVTIGHLCERSYPRHLGLMELATVGRMLNAPPESTYWAVNMILALALDGMTSDYVLSCTSTWKTMA